MAWITFRSEKGWAVVTEYRIDDLARAAGTTTRSVRLYQQRGILAGPRLEGRVGFYSEAHLARLRVIGELLGRGHNLASVREVLTAWERGARLDDVVGLERTMTQGPGVIEEPLVLTAGQLSSALDGQLGGADLDRAVALGVLDRQEDGYLLHNPSRLASGGALVALGLPMSRVLDLTELVQQATARLAAALVEEVREFVVPPGAVADEKFVGAARAAIDALLPLARSLVDLELQRALRRELTSEFDAFLSAGAGEIIG